MKNQTFTGRLALGFALCCMPLLTMACSAADDSAEHPESAGRLTFALTSTTANGVVYRLRDATFDIKAGSFDQESLSSETDPNSSTLTTQLQPGAYTVSLIASFRLEKEVAGAYVDVPAELLSPRTQAFDITAGASTAVAYEFKVAGEVVTMGGSLVLSTHVVEESCQEDLAENNDTLATARPITTGTTYNLALCLGDEDYFVLDGVSGKQVTVDLAFLNAQGDLDVYVTNEDGLGRGSSASTGDGEHVTVASFEGTRAVIRVVGFRNASNAYTLNTAVVIPGQPTVPAGWTCNVDYYGSGDGCDCGCGVVDVDCSSSTAACGYDNCPAPMHANPANNTQCL